MSAPSILLTVTVIAIAYPIGMRLLINAAQPMRLKMADLGNELLDDDTIPDAHKMVVANMMDDAFEWRFMIFAVFKMPQFAWAKLRGHYLGDPLMSVPTAENREKIQQMVKYFTFSTGVANPIFFAFATLELLLLMPCTRALKAFGFKSWELSTIAQRVVLKAETQFSHSGHHITTI